MKLKIAYILVIFLSPLCLSCSALSFGVNKSDTVFVRRFESGSRPTQEGLTKAIDKLNSQKGGTLVLQRNGVYHMRPSVEHLFDLPSNAVIDGNGATIIIEDNSNTSSFTWDCIFYAENKNNITIRNLTIDSNGERNPVLQKSIPNAASRHNGLLSALYTNNINIENCVVKNVVGYGCLYLGYCNNVKVEKCKFYNIGVKNSTSYIGDASVLMGVGNNWLIENNFIKNDYLANCGTGLDLACSNSIVRNNHVESFWAGINLTNNGLSHSTNVCVENNELINNNTAFFLWSSYYPYKGDCCDHVIENNLIKWDSRQEGWGSRGIDMSACAYGDIHNIQIKNNKFCASNYNEAMVQSYEIAINMSLLANRTDGSPNDHCSIEAVDICCNEFTGVSGVAIQMGSKVNNVNIHNNIIKDCAYSNVDYSYNACIVYTRNSRDKTDANVLIESNSFINTHGHNIKGAIYLLNVDENIIGPNDNINIDLIRKN